MYEYKMVEVPRDLSVKAGKANGVAAEIMQKIVDAHTVEGWEFYRTDSLTVTEKPGCLAGLFGAKEIYRALNVICFRRERSGKS